MPIMLCQRVPSNGRDFAQHGQLKTTWNLGQRVAFIFSFLSLKLWWVFSVRVQGIKSQNQEIKVWFDGDVTVFLGTYTCTASKRQFPSCLIWSMVQPLSAQCCAPPHQRLWAVMAFGNGWPTAANARRIVEMNPRDVRGAPVTSMNAGPHWGGCVLDT